ncbi:unnamed protein product [Closterium sp. NIES-64]|nr:unnamed protein product [Closterium sp. NIES-64]
MSQEQPRREEMEGQAKVRFSTFFYLPFQHAPIGNPYTIPLSPPAVCYSLPFSALLSLSAFTAGAVFNGAHAGQQQLALPATQQEEQLSLHPQQQVGWGRMGKGTDMSAMGLGLGGRVWEQTGMGGGGTAGGEAGGMGGGMGATGGGDTEMMGGDVGGESIGARGSAEPTVTSAGDIAKAKEAGAAAAGGKTGGAETGGEGFMGRESEAKAMEGEGGIGSA